jgi:hypothetical protein
VQITSLQKDQIRAKGFSQVLTQISKFKLVFSSAPYGLFPYLLGVGAVAGLDIGLGAGLDTAGVNAGLDIGVGADSAPLGEGEATGELSAFGEGDGFSFAVLPFVRV